MQTKKPQPKKKSEVIDKVFKKREPGLSKGTVAAIGAATTLGALAAVGGGYFLYNSLPEPTQVSLRNLFDISTAWDSDTNGIRYTNPDLEALRRSDNRDYMYGITTPRLLPPQSAMSSAPPVLALVPPTLRRSSFAESLINPPSRMGGPLFGFNASRAF